MADTATLDDIAKKFDSLIKRAIKIRAYHQELLAQAFIEALGVPIDQIELVEVREGSMMRWFYRRRERAA